MLLHEYFSQRGQDFEVLNENGLVNPSTEVTNLTVDISNMKSSHNSLKMH